MGEQSARIPPTPEDDTGTDASECALVESAPTAMAITAGGTHILRCANTAFLRLLGKVEKSVIGHPFTDAMDGSGLEEVALTLDRVYRTGNAETTPEQEQVDLGGEHVHGAIAVWPIPNGVGRRPRLAIQVNTVIATAQTTRSVTERLLLSALQEQERSEEAQRYTALMEHHALHDALTSLPNRTLLADRTTQAIKAAGRVGKGVALIFVDLNRFKAVNDRFGHHIGDAVLQQVGSRIGGVLREVDTVARLGGDEFAILLADVTDTADAAVVARKILDTLSSPFVVGAVHHTVGASVGIAVYPDDGTDFHMLLRRADAAMYVAKRAGIIPAPDEEPQTPRTASGDNEGDGGAAQRGAGQRERDLRNASELLVLSGLREQERADQLSQHLSFTRAITHNLIEGVYALDTDGRLTFINPAAARLLGWASAELPSEYPLGVTPFRHADDLAMPVRISVQEGPSAFTSNDDDLVCVRRDGSTFPVAYTVTPMVTDGVHVGVVVTFRDITAVRALEQAREEYVSLIAHDLRNPLTAIIGRAELLQRTLQRQGMDRAMESTQTILTSAQLINRMLTDLQEQTRLESGHIVLSHVPTSLNRLLARAIDQVEQMEGSTPIPLDAAMPLRATIDAAQIERVVLNLLTNARKYSPAGSPISVRLVRVGLDAVVSIADRGVGIAETDLPHLFEKYYRTSHTTTTGGLGLGLYISRLIIETHGGRLWAESAIGVGSTFHFALPLAE